MSPALMRVYEQGTLLDESEISAQSGARPNSANNKRSYFWDWLVVAIIPTAVLLLLVLLLSVIFFGQREGQHWRDYKTPQ